MVRAMQRFVVVGLSLLALLGGGCRIDPGTGKSALSIVGSGLVNDPTNKSLRFDLLRFGLDEFCRELLVRGAPIRLSDDQPVIGRFFARDCQAKTVDDPTKQTVLVQFGGPGYAWTQATGRLGFEARGLMELSPDFRLHDEALYVYFRPIHVDTSFFELKMTELAYASAGASILGLDEQEIGRAIIQAQLGRGFTVIRYDADGHADFALGLIDVGERPFRPFSVLSSSQTTLANGRTELVPEAQDFLGRIHLGPNESLKLHLRLEGASEVDVLLLSVADHPDLIDRFVGTKGPYETTRSTWSGQLVARAPFRGEIRAPEGDYFLAFDFSSRLGASEPRSGALPARVDYLVQVGPRTSE